MILTFLKTTKVSANVSLQTGNMERGVMQIWEVGCHHFCQEFAANSLELNHKTVFLNPDKCKRFDFSDWFSGV